MKQKHYFSEFKAYCEAFGIACIDTLDEVIKDVKGEEKTKKVQLDINKTTRMRSPRSPAPLLLKDGAGKYVLMIACDFNITYTEHNFVSFFRFSFKQIMVKSTLRRSLSIIYNQSRTSMVFLLSEFRMLS